MRALRYLTDRGHAYEDVNPKLRLCGQGGKREDVPNEKGVIGCCSSVQEIVDR